MMAVLDSNCFINAVRDSADEYSHMQCLLSAAKAGKIKIMVSRHSVDELSRKPDDAHELAKTVEVVPYWPIGAICEQVATIEQLTGTWEDARRNEELQLELAQLAKSGNDIRDRGAYLDALHARADFFVTSDRQLVGSGPAKRIQDRFGLRVLKPSQLVSEFHL
jgi:predicted nucleic acid-binding protein